MFLNFGLSFAAFVCFGKAVTIPDVHSHPSSPIKSVETSYTYNPFPSWLPRLFLPLWLFIFCDSMACTAA